MLEDVEVFATHYVTHERERRADPPAHHAAGRRRHAPRGVSRADLRSERGPQRGVRHADVPLPLPVADHAGLRLRLRRPDARADAARSRRTCWAATTPRATARSASGPPPTTACACPSRWSAARRRRATARRPCCLTGYGSYGAPYPVTFSSNRLSLLDRGFTIAIAHIRGGGELGKRWHDAGRMMNKSNTFTDFIACAEHLKKEGYTATERLVDRGRQRRRPADRRRAQPAPRSVPRRHPARALRGRDQHHARRIAAAHGGRVRGVGQSEDPRAVRVHEDLLPVHEPGRARLPGRCSSRPH